MAANAAAPLVVPDRARLATISVEGAGIRWISDGQTPNANYGMPVSAGDSFEYCGVLSNLMLIRQSNGAKINVSFSR
jgi:hypothetical protein